MFEGVLNTPVVRLHLVMFFVIIANTDRIFQILKWLEDNLLSFEYFRKIGLIACHRKARRGRDSSLSSFLIRYNTLAPWRTTFSIQTNGNHHQFSFGYQYVATFWFILLTKPMFWLQEWSWFGCCFWIYFLSTLFQDRTNLLGSQDSEESM